jgi:hypothetical protein
VAVAPIIDDGLFATWYEHPITRVARAQLGDETPSALELFEVMHGLLTELDEKFPGVPMRQILTPRRAHGGWRASIDPSLVRGALLAAGVDAERAELAAPRRGRPVDPVLDRALAQEVANGLTQRAVARKYKVGPQRVKRALRRVLESAGA